MRSLAKVFTRFAVLTVLACSLLSGFALAESASGQFTLPGETHWSTVTLPAGDYRYSVQLSGPMTVVLVRSTSGRPAAMFATSSVSELSSSDVDRLVLDHVGGQRYVKSFHLKQLGVVLNYKAAGEEGGVAGMEKSAAAEDPQASLR